MNKLISANYWFGCDWCFYEVGYLGLWAGQLSLACAVVNLWNTDYLRVTRQRMNSGIQHFNILPGEETLEELEIDVISCCIDRAGEFCRVVWETLLFAKTKPTVSPR